MNIQQVGNSYMDLVNRVMGMLQQSTPGYAMAQADKNLQQQGIGFGDPRYLKDPSVKDALLDIAMAGTTSGPEKMSADMVKKLLSGKAVRTIRPDPKFLKEQMDSIINRVRTF